MKEDDILKNAEYLIKDLLYGDENVTGREDYLGLRVDQIQRALKLITDNPSLNSTEKKYFLDNTWRVSYMEKPPTPEGFFDPYWLGAINDEIYDHIKQTFIQFMSPLSPYRVLALSTTIGFGKSFLSTLIAVYLIIHLSYLRDPKKFFGVNVAGSLVIALMSFTIKKAKQVLLQPFYQMLRASPIFQRTLREDRLDWKQQEIGTKNIAYTSAGRMGSFQFAKDIHISVEADRASILGLNIVMGIASEISFWIERGIPVDEIWGTFNDLRNRINNRFYHRYLTCTILDSSPYDISLSPIDKWLYNGAAKDDPEVMFVNSKTWEVFPWKFPVWQKTGQTFPVFLGDGARQPKILTDAEVKDYSHNEVDQVPIDFKGQYEDDLEKCVKDFSAWPAGSQTKLIPNFKVIDESFSPQLKNVYTYITAKADEMPEQLIWNKVYKDFFVQFNGVDFEFYRYPKAQRYIHIDLAEAHDDAAIGCCHMEVDSRGNNVVIMDFTIVISPQKGRINLDAIADFVLDLRRLGHMRIVKVTADRFQSSAIIQRLSRYEFDVSHLSVDRDISHYRVAISWLLNHRIKMGRNIIVKNNWKSLIEQTSDAGNKKIEHIKAKKDKYYTMSDWEISSMGYGAKDATDTIAGAASTCINDTKSRIPPCQWDDSLDEMFESKVLTKPVEDSTLDISKGMKKFIISSGFTISQEAQKIIMGD